MGRTAVSTSPSCSSVTGRGKPPQGFVRYNPRTAFFNQGSLGVDFAPDGKTLADAGMGGATIVDVSKRPWLELRQVEGGGWTYAVAYSSDGKTLATGGDGFRAQLLDPKTGKGIHTLHSTRSVKSLAFSPDGLSAVVGAGSQGFGAVSVTPFRSAHIV